jgi:hypothetical protein
LRRSRGSSISPQRLTGRRSISATSLGGRAHANGWWPIRGSISSIPE